MAFSIKQISNQGTLGEQLTKRREALGYTREAVARMAGLAVPHVVALEEGAYALLPGLVYMRQYVRLYNSILGFPLDELFKRADHEFKVSEGKNAVRLPSRVATQELVRREPLIASVRNLGVSVGLVCAFVVVGVSFIRFFEPPHIEITTPLEGATVARGMVTVEGRTSPESEISINGDPVIQNDRGEFREQVAVSEGVQVLKIKAQKKHSRARVIERRMFVE